VFILEPAINPALEQQAIGRIHRLGNVHREVVVSYLIMAGSVEENIVAINRDKLQQLERQKKKQEEERERGAQQQPDDEDEKAAGSSDVQEEQPRFGRHATNANADSGAGINTVSQGSLHSDVALFRLGELEKLFTVNRPANSS
jgi:superfamily II DNA or RNA helicase